MKDTIIKGDGTSRKLKAPSTIPESFEDFRSALVAGNLHVDISLDEDGCDVVGTPLNKASLLKDATAQKFGLNPLTATVDDVLAAVVTPQLRVTAPAGSSITVTDGTTTLTGTGGTVTFSLPNYGTWNITATLSGQSASGSVSVDAVKQYSVSLSYFSATINVTFPSGSTCTCKNGSTTLTATGTPYAFHVPNAGTWEVKSTNGSETATQNVSITTSGQTVNVTLSYKPTASTSPKSGVSYGTDLSGITAAKMKLYGEAISNNSAITNTTSDVYIDDGATHIKMSVGASKSMTIDGGSYEFIIIGFNHDTLTTPTYYGAATATGKAGITWQTRHCLNTKRQMNSSNTNVGGWTSCAMRTSTMAMTSEERKELRYLRRKEKREQKRKLLYSPYDDFDTVFSFRHLYLSGKRCAKGVYWKNSTQRYIGNLIPNTAKAYRGMHDGTFEHKGFHESSRVLRPFLMRSSHTFTSPLFSSNISVTSLHHCGCNKHGEVCNSILKFRGLCITLFF